MKIRKNMKALVESWQVASDWAKIQRREQAGEHLDRSLDVRQMANILLITQL